MADTTTAQPDFRVENHGSIFLLHTENDAAHDFLVERVDYNDDHQWFAGALVVEHRYIRPLVATLQAEGFVVR